MTGAIKPPAWYDQAACVGADPRDFYVEKGMTARVAKQICARCPVRLLCLQDALDRDDQYGVWGGTTEHERRELKKRNGTHFCECGERFAKAHGLRSNTLLHCKLRKAA